VLREVADAPFNILHVCGDENRIEELLDYPVSALNWDDHGEANPTLATIQRASEKAVMGGVSQQTLGTLGPEAVEAHVREALRGCGRPLFVTGVARVSRCGIRGSDVSAEPTTPGPSAAACLDLALAAEAWIDSTRIDTEHGVAWPDLVEEPQRVGISLYYGASGTVLFYLELFAITGDERFRTRAIAGADDLAARAEGKRDPLAGLYQGLSGIAFALQEVGVASGEERFGRAARRIIGRVGTLAEERGAGLAWIEPMPFSELHGRTGMKEVLDLSRGAAGVGLALLYAHENALHEEALAWATAAGDRLIEVAEPTEAGLQWQMVREMPFRWTAPNFSHGTAGVAFFLARLHEATGERRYLEAARAGAEQIRAVASVEGESRLVYHHETRGDPLYYLSWCHGPAGTGRLFHQLARSTGEDGWMEWLLGGVRGIRKLGAPEQRSPGLWNNVSQCCGDAGIGELGLSAYRVTGQEECLDLARHVAASLEARSTRRDEGVCWVQAEHRDRPDFLRTHTGYMQGAAGIGSFLLRLHGRLAGRDAKIAFPDSPFG
jgi:hypothetical protein